MKIKKAVFPAAGLGTRFLPATKASPKEMLPVVDKPIIQYVVEEAVRSGVDNVIMVTGRGKRAIEDHFDKSFELEYELERKGKLDLLKKIRKIAKLAYLSYVRQKEALGLGHAILVAKNLVDDEPFAVLLGDDLVYSKIPCLKQLINVYNKYKCSVLAVERVPREQIHSYGVIGGTHIEDNIYQVDELVEKPSPARAPSNLAIIGRYVLTPRIFKALEKTQPDQGGEIQLTNALKILKAKEPIYACEFVGKRYDAGDKLGFLQATVEYALRRPDLASKFKAYLKDLDVNLI